MSIADAMTVRVVTASPEESVQTAIGRMLDAHVGAVAVCEQGRLVGIFTERDVLRLAGAGARFGETRLAEAMTRSVLTVTPDVDVLDAAQLMGERRIRHLPVVEGDNLVGMTSARDVLRALVERLYRVRDDGARETARELLARA